MDKKIQNLRKLQQYNNAKIAPFLKGVETASFSVDINRYFTDVDGTIIDKNNVVIPSILKTFYPVYLFGTYDKDGGYYHGLRTVNPSEGTYFVFNGVKGNFFNLLQFSGANNVRNQINDGDHILLYTDDPVNPNFFIWIVITSERRSYASILQNPNRLGMDIFSSKYFADNLLQFNESLQFITFNDIGDFQSREINPYMFKTTDYQQDGFIDIRMQYNLNNYIGIYFPMRFETDNISIIFRYTKLKI